MSKFKTSIGLIKNNRGAFFARLLQYSSRIFWNDKQYLRFLFRFKMGTWPDFDNPTSFNEKIQWLKLNNRNPEYTRMVDKYLVKEYVESKIGKDYVVRTLGIWDNPSQIKWDELPEGFVLKTTHGGGSSGVVICRNKEDFDKDKAIRQLNNSMKDDIYTRLREWPYKNVKKRIIAEELLIDHSLGSNCDLTDYKFYCFNGDPIYCQVIKDRHTKETIDFFDKKWQHMPFIGFTPTAVHSSKEIPKPQNYDLMLSLAKQLSSNIPFARIDLYSIEGKVYFGEITFYPNSGFGFLKPLEWNHILGDQLDISHLFTENKVLQKQ